MAADTAVRTFKVQQLDRQYDLRVDLGTLSVGPEGQLAVVSARPNYEQYLANIVETVNGKEQLSIKVPPPAGGTRYGIYTVTVDRTAPDLLERMREFLEQKYDLLLVDDRPTAPAPAPPGGAAK
jgi:hypothetical protein